uniref:lantibiotic immunity ABC transporter MutE/EpiE family permease subunit n=1 Tax=Faecalicatena contorta TaxID=39482 RepID=UPI00359C861B
MLLAYVKSENLKNRHTVASRLFWLVPLFSILLSFVFSGQDGRYYQMNQYNWWYTTFFPMLLLLSTAFAGQRERKMKNRAMGALPINMKTLWSAKILYSLKTLVLAVLILFCVQEVVSRLLVFGGAREISGLAGLAAAVLWIVLSLWQIPLWLFVNQSLGFAAGILLGLAGNIGLGILGALTKWWVVNPFTYISRLMCPILKILPNGLPAEPGSQTFFPEVLKITVIPLGVCISVALFLGVWALTAGWYAGKGQKGWES